MERKDTIKVVLILNAAGIVGPMIIKYDRAGIMLRNWYDWMDHKWV